MHRQAMAMQLSAKTTGMDWNKRYQQEYEKLFIRVIGSNIGFRNKQFLNK